MFRHLKLKMEIKIKTVNFMSFLIDDEKCSRKLIPFGLRLKT